MTESCPNCDYSMRGLPDRHNCPECGFAYDRAAEVIYCGNKIPIFFLSFGGICLLLAVSKGMSDPWNLAGVAVFCAGLIVGLLKLKRRRCVVLDHKGIALIGLNAPATSFAWRDIERIEYAEFLGRARIVAAHGEKPVAIESEFLGSDNKVRMFVASANEWLARHRAESERVDAPDASWRVPHPERMRRVGDGDSP